MERGEKENGKGNNTGKEKEKRKKWNEVGGKIGKGKRLERKEIAGKLISKIRHQKSKAIKYSVQIFNRFGTSRLGM